MSPGVGFLVFLGVTLVLLGGVVATGYAAKRKQHLTLVFFAVTSLLTTIYFAEKLGTLYDLESAGWIYPVHLAFAKTTTVAYLAPIVLGWITMRRPTMLLWHRRAAFTVLFLTVCTAATGAWMLLAADKLPA